MVMFFHGSGFFEPIFACKSSVEEMEKGKERKSRREWIREQESREEGVSKSAVNRSPISRIRSQVRFYKIVYGRTSNLGRKNAIPKSCEEREEEEQVDWLLLG